MTNGNVIKFLLNIFSFTIVFFVIRANCRRTWTVPWSSWLGDHTLDSQWALLLHT